MKIESLFFLILFTLLFEPISTLLAENQTLAPITNVSNKLTNKQKNTDRRLEKMLSDSHINKIIQKIFKDKRKELKDIKEPYLALNTKPILNETLQREELLMKEIITLTKKNNVTHIEALTLVAKKNAFAIQLMKEIAQKIGQELAYFYKENLWMVRDRDPSFLIKINGDFGRDIYSFENKNVDIYIQTIRESFIKELKLRKYFILSLAKKIVRSLPTSLPEPSRAALSA